MNAKKVPLLPPEYTTAERDAMRPSLRKVGCIIYNTTTGQHEKWNGASWEPFVGSGGGSFTQLAYLAPPATNSDADQQAWITAFVADMITKNNMGGPPTYVLSGQITGAVQNNITVERRDNGTNALIDTVTTNATGNYSFPARVAGTYKITPILAGHYFTPANAVITLSANTVQNFVSAVSTSSAEVSNNFVLISGGSNLIRFARKSPFAMETGSFSDWAGGTAYGQAFANGYWFIPRYQGGNNIRVHADGNGNEFIALDATGVTNIFRIFVDGTRLLAVGSGTARFFDINFGTMTLTPLGAGATNLPSAFLDAVYMNGRAYIIHGAVTAPNRNMVIADFAAATFSNVSIDSNAGITHIGAGNGLLCTSVSGTGVRKIIDATSLATLASSTSIPSSQSGRTAFSGNRFWATIGNQLRWFEYDGVAVNTGLATFAGGANPLPSGLFGCVADATTVYALDNSASRLFRVNAATAAEIAPSIVTPFSGAYLKN